MMFRSVSLVVNLILRRNAIFNHYRCLSNLKSPQSVQDTTAADNNEWLWEYLRHRQSFQTLNDQQKRQVISLE